MINSLAQFKLHCWKSALLGSWAFIREHLKLSAGFVGLIGLTFHFFVFGEQEFLSEVRPVVSGFLALGTVWGLVFLWELFKAPYGIYLTQNQVNNSDVSEAREVTLTQTQEIEGLRAKLDDRARRQRIADGLARLRGEGQEIVLQWREHSSHNHMKDRAEQWFTQAQKYIQEQMSFSEMDIFRSFMSQGPPLTVHQWERDRHFFASKVEKLRTMVEDLHARLR